MNAHAWVIAAMLCSAGLAPCAWMCLRGGPEQRLVGVEMTSIVVVLVMTMLCVGFGRASYIDLPLTMAVLSFGGGLIFARFMERHL